MCNRLLVHMLQAIENLPNIMFDMVHVDCTSCFLSLPQCVFQTGIAILHHGILDNSLLLIDGVEELNELHDVWGTFKERKHFIFTRDDIARFLGSFQSHSLVAIDIECFEDIAC